RLALSAPRSAGGRGEHLLRARRHRYDGDAGGDSEGLGAQKDNAGRLYHHAATGQESLPLQLAQSAAQGEGILHRPRAGKSPFEEADPRALSQRRGDGRARLRSRSCRTNLLSHVSVRSISAASGADRRLFAQSTRNESRRAEFTPALAPADDPLEDAPMGLRRRAAYGEEASGGAAGHGDSRGAAANGADGH